MTATPHSPSVNNKEHDLLDLSIVVPAYLEAESLKLLLPAIKAAAQALTPSHEILIIDTQTSMDDTAAVCALNGVCHVPRIGGNQYGDAVRTGIRIARGRHLLSMDADGSHSPEYFASMWAKRNAYDVVIGSRYVSGGHTENPAILIFMSYVLNLTFRVAFNIHAKDVTNSFRIYRTDILRPLHLESNDFDILEEILIRAVTHQPPATIAEVPVTFGRRKAGESKRQLIKFVFGYLSTLRKLKNFQKAARHQSEAR